jgi:hypothetical protein
MQHGFDDVFNSKNIEDAYGTNPELCVYAGVPAEKFIANCNPDADMAVIENAIENIKRINPKKLVLISTIDVLSSKQGSDENTQIIEEELDAYGFNRYQLEKWCVDNIENCHIMRLPSLFGANIKKNFIYDIIHILPKALDESKFNDFAQKEKLIDKHYAKQDNGFYVLKPHSKADRADLIEAFKRLDFSAINFTDSRAKFQFYNLAYIAGQTKFAIESRVKLMHLVVEPMSAAELYYAVKGEEFINEITDTPPNYDCKSIHAEMFGGLRGYFFVKQRMINEIKNLVKNYVI